MSRIIYFTDNESAGFQLSTRVMDTLQSELQDLIEAFICVIGNNVILCGVDGPISGTQYTEGLIIWNNEFLAFEGGTFGNYLVIHEEETELRFCDGNDYKAYTIRTARFQNSIVPGDEYIEVANEDGLGFLSPIVSLSQFYVDYTAQIASINSQLTTINNTVTNNALADNSEIGDVKYIKNISNFNGSGLGLAGTNREGWALVNNVNTEWKTALGFAGTFNDIDGRVLAIAGTKYSVLDQFGADDVELSKAEIPKHTHEANGDGATINITSSGAHNHDPGWATFSMNEGGGTLRNPLQTGAGNTTSTNSHTHPNSSFNGMVGDGTTDGLGLGTGGAGQAHENRQPSLALYMAVKYA